MEKKVGVAYTRLKDNVENGYNVGDSAPAPSSSPLSKHQPIRGSLAQRVHAFNKQRNDRPLIKSTASEGNELPSVKLPPRSKVLEAVRAFEAINKNTAEPDRSSTPLAIRELTGNGHSAAPVVEKGKELAEDCVDSPNTTLLNDSHDNVETIACNKAADGLDATAGPEDSALLDQSRILDELAAIVETFEIEDKPLDNEEEKDVTDSSPEEENKPSERASPSDGEILRILGALQVRITQTTQRAGNSVDKVLLAAKAKQTNSQSSADDTTPSVTNETKSFASVETEVRETIARMTRAFMSFSEHVSTELNAVAKALLQGDEKHSLSPGFKYKLLALIRKRVIEEAVQKAREKYPIPIENVITAVKKVKLTGDLLIGQDETEITILSVAKPSKDATAVDDASKAPALHKQLKEIIASTLLEDLRIRKPKSLEPTDDEMAILQLAPKASSDDDSATDDSQANVSNSRRGATSIENLLGLSPVDPALILDVAMMLQSDSPVDRLGGDVSVADSTSELEETMVSRDESLFIQQLDVNYDESLDNFDFTRDGTTLLADDEATYDEDETTDEFSHHQSYIDSSLVPCRTDGVIVSAELQSREAPALTESSHAATTVGVHGDESTDDFSFVNEDNEQEDDESVYTARSRHSGSSTEVTANGGDSKLYRSVTVLNSTPISVLPMNYSIVSGLNSTWPSVTLFSDGDTLDGPSLLFGDTINLDFVQDKKDGDSCSLEASSNEMEMLGPGVDQVLNIFRPTLMSLVNSATPVAKQSLPTSEEAKVSGEDGLIAQYDSWDTQDAELSSSEDDALRAMIERPIADEVKVDDSSVESSSSQEGGRLWKIINAQIKSQDQASGHHENVVVNSSPQVAETACSVDPPPSHVMTPPSEGAIDTFKLASLLPGDDDDDESTTVDDIRSGPYVYDNAAFADVNPLVCGDEPVHALCGSSEVVLPWKDISNTRSLSITLPASDVSSKPSRQKTRFVSPVKDTAATKSIPVLARRAKKKRQSLQIRIPPAVPAKDDSRVIECPTGKGSRPHVVSPSSVETRDASPIGAGFYIAEMMGQELLQVATDLISLCDEYGKKPTKTHEPNQSWLRCW